ncbi:MAG: IgGFc-binding protein [Bacteroidetes bacterium]|nr:IgGFc-binding protein [Bacteroidota bacterium]
MVQAQGVSNEGRDFYLGLLSPSFNKQSVNYFGKNLQGLYKAYAVVSTYSDNQITLNYFDDNGYEVNFSSYSVAGGHSIRIPLDIERMQMAEPGEVAEMKACHIRAVKPVTVQFYSAGSNSGESYLALPTATLGKVYVVQSYFDNEGGIGGVLSNENASGCFMVIATFDATTVTIIPSSTTIKKHQGVNCGAGNTGIEEPFTVRLNHGQAYLVKGKADGSGCDMSNSQVIADKPVVVIAGHENAFTIGSDPALVGSSGLEARNYMVEQMLPVNIWDTMGYVSIPFLDSPGASAGKGDEFAFYSGVIPSLNLPGPSGTKINVTPSHYLDDVAPYAVPPPDIIGDTMPIEAHATNGVKMAMVQYDQRMQGSAPPFPAPTQMTIVPMSRWKRTYILNVPNDSVDQGHSHFINVICNTSDYTSGYITVSKDGAPAVALNAFGTVRATWPKIPNFDSLSGYSIAVDPGTLLIRGATASPYMVYNYGDPTYDFDSMSFKIKPAVFATTYSNPAGFMLAGNGQSIGSSVDTLCAKWHLCAQIPTGEKRAIQSFQIVDDAKGDFLPQPGRSFNVRLYSLIFPDQIGEIAFGARNRSECADIVVENPFDTAEATVQVNDDQGNTEIVHLHWSPMPVMVSTIPRTVLQHDTVRFPVVSLHGDTCVTINYSVHDADTSVRIEALSLTHGDAGFRIASTTPALPVSLSNGDSLAVTVCYSSVDTVHRADSLVVRLSCANQYIGVFARGGVGRFSAGDLSIDSVPLSAIGCGEVELRNLGDFPISITDTSIVGDGAITWDPANTVRLPFTIPPGGSVPVRFCFHPVVAKSDTVIVYWTVADADGVRYAIKSTSSLRGSTLNPALVSSQGESLHRMYATQTNGLLRVKMTEDVGAVSSAMLYDVLGRCVGVWARDEISIAGNELRVHLPPLAAGSYILRVDAGNNPATLTIIIF